MVLWTMLNLLLMKTNRAVAMETPDFSWRGATDDLRYGNFFPTPFIHAINLELAPMLAANHEVVWHYRPSRAANCASELRYRHKGSRQAIFRILDQLAQLGFGLDPESIRVHGLPNDLTEIGPNL
jgi:hypothetical protein